MKIRNTQSGFRSTGIFHFDPDVIPEAAFAPSTLTHKYIPEMMDAEPENYSSSDDDLPLAKFLKNNNPSTNILETPVMGTVKARQKRKALNYKAQLLKREIFTEHSSQANSTKSSKSRKKIGYVVCAMRILRMADRKKKLNTLDSFFTKQQKIGEDESTNSSTSTAIVQADNEQPSTSQFSARDQDNINQHDIAHFVGHKVNIDIIKVITDLWKPMPDFKFPVSSKRNLKFQYCWFHRWNWLAYSQKEDGAYCKFCVFYAETGGVGSQSLGKLVKAPFNNWKDAVEAFDKHQVKESHKFSVVKFSHQQLIVDQKQQFIDLQIDVASKNKIIGNRKKLVPIVDAIILCGRQGIPLRGHDDSGPIESADIPVHNDGNFRAILRTNLKDNAEGEFNQIFKDVETSCKEMDIEMALPRTNSRQTQRNNVPAEVPEEYFRRAYFIPFVDSSINHLKEKLLKHNKIVQGFQVLLPNKHFNEGGLEKLYDFYEHFLEACSFETLLGEVKLWR
ncbi:unnamed protein product [Acanthoscelides obtectus]|uniref:TTF-type domain-containing protein n=1 Tax=Acanthoscelides obtectus TaxID=200917 RepID=A0A9P0PU15_ACAOB|nr:unnamed protein product [Acanthoscelides obtectus]CAK1671373.1 Zinc finger MYM-type protein 1 [Acanthoscelides obtectus]